MRLPNADEAHVDRAKLEHYLVSQSHPIGRSKARFFRGVGFNESNLVMLEQTLIGIAGAEEIVETTASAYGTKYIVDGSIATPSGDQARLRTVWIIEEGQGRPRFVTAYPI